MNKNNKQNKTIKKENQMKRCKAILAQSVERTALNRVVEGSIPSDRDSSFFFLWIFCACF